MTSPSEPAYYSGQFAPAGSLVAPFWLGPRPSPYRPPVIAPTQTLYNRKRHYPPFVYDEQIGSFATQFWQAPKVPASQSSTFLEQGKWGCCYDKKPVQNRRLIAFIDNEPQAWSDGNVGAGRAYLYPLRPKKCGCTALGSDYAVA